VDHREEVKSEMKKNKKQWTKEMKQLTSEQLIRTDTVESWNFSTAVKGTDISVYIKGFFTPKSGDITIQYSLQSTSLS